MKRQRKKNDPESVCKSKQRWATHNAAHPETRQRWLETT